MSKQKLQSKKIKRSTLLGVYAAIMLSIGLLFAAITSLNGDPIVNSLLVFGLYIPVVAIITTLTIGYVIFYVWKFWLWIVPNWIAFVINIPKWQAVWVYSILLVGFDVIIGIGISYLLDGQLLQVVLLFMGAASIISIGRTASLYNRYPRYYIQGLTDLRVPIDAKQKRSADLINVSKKNVTKTFHYTKFASKNMGLPHEISVLQNSLYSSMESYTALQQGTDTEDARLSQQLRACLMAQYIGLKASGYKHFFILKDMDLTHIGKAPSQFVPRDSPQNAYYAAYITAQLYETITKVDDTPPSDIHPIKTPFFIVFSMQQNEVYIQTIQLEESRIESNQIRKELVQLAQANNLLYVPQLAHALLPRTGLLATKGALRRWSIASNFMTGHTNNHAFSLLSIQPYARMKNYGSYIVGSTIVPKSYDRIIVADKRSRLFTIAASLPIQRISTESSDFSSRFAIFIGQESSIPSLELLNPSFMNRLLHVPVELTVEVVDRHIYFYFPTNEITQADFSAVLELMHLAHDELRL